MYKEASGQIWNEKQNKTKQKNFKCIADQDLPKNEQALKHSKSTSNALSATSLSLNMKRPKKNNFSQAHKYNVTNVEIVSALAKILCTL